MRSFLGYKAAMRIETDSVVVRGQRGSLSIIDRESHYWFIGALRSKGVSEIWRIWIGEKRMAPLRFLRFILVGKDLMVYFK